MDGLHKLIHADSYDHMLPCAVLHRHEPCCSYLAEHPSPNPHACSRPRLGDMYVDCVSSQSFVPECTSAAALRGFEKHEADGAEGDDTRRPICG